MSDLKKHAQESLNAISRLMEVCKNELDMSQEDAVMTCLVTAHTIHLFSSGHKKQLPMRDYIKLAKGLADSIMRGMENVRDAASAPKAPTVFDGLKRDSRTGTGEASS